LLLPYGDGMVDVPFPDSAQVDTIIYRMPGEKRGDAETMIRQALEEPVGSSPLRSIAKGRKNAVILISDVSRLCPSYLFLPFLVEELNAGGIPDDRITIVVALGLHRRQTEEELRQLTGAVFGRVRVVNHNAQPENCVYVGTSKLGTDIELNRIVVEADLRIATGNIEPHRLVGISGGPKALFPGVASSRSIEQNHSLSHQFQAEPGDPNNPIHQDLAEVLHFTPIDFLFNVVVTHDRKLLGAVAGRLKDAHTRGAALARDAFLVNAAKRYDVVVASAGGYPKDMQLYQAVKSLQNAASVANEGADILLLARCQELFGNGTFELWVETMGELQTTAEQLKKKFVIGAHKIEHVAKITKKHNVFLFSDMPDAIVRLLDFEPVHDLNRWVTERCSGKDTRSIAVFPYGSITYPVIG
jgi:lactate racemase